MHFFMQVGCEGYKCVGTFCKFVIVCIYCCGWFWNSNVLNFLHSLFYKTITMEHHLQHPHLYHLHIMENQLA